MSELHLPWLEICILIPLAGAAWVARLRGDPHEARRWCLLISGLTTFAAVAAWQDFLSLHTHAAEDRWHLMSLLFGHEVFVIDELSAPLLPLTASLYLLTILTTLKTKIRRFSFAWTLLSEAIALATFSCSEPWGLIALLILGTVPPWLELKARRKPTRAWLLHMLLFAGLLVTGWSFVVLEGEQKQVHSLWAVIPLLMAVLIRSGIVPLHCWMTELFQHATFGTALLFAAPLAGAFAAVRLVLPIAPDWVLRSIGLVSLVTAVYAAGMALVQREARRFFCYLFLSHSSLVLVGLEMVTPIGLTGALCLWLSIGLSLGGFGLTLRAVEARRGRVLLTDFQGLYEHTPGLAVCFILTGLASVGFPGTTGFVGTELLVDGAVGTYLYSGIAVVIAAALNGIAVVRAWFLIFTGTRYQSTVSLGIGTREQFAIVTLAAIILIGGLIPQPGVESRFHAARVILEERAAVSSPDRQE